MVSLKPVLDVLLLSFILDETKSDEFTHDSLYTGKCT